MVYKTKKRTSRKLLSKKYGNKSKKIHGKSMKKKRNGKKMTQKGGERDWLLRRSKKRKEITELVSDKLDFTDTDIKEKFKEIYLKPIKDLDKLKKIKDKLSNPKAVISVTSEESGTFLPITDDNCPSSTKTKLQS